MGLESLMIVNGSGLKLFSGQKSMIPQLNCLIIGVAFSQGDL